MINACREKESAYLVKTEIIQKKINQISYENIQNRKIYTRRTESRRRNFVNMSS